VNYEIEKLASGICLILPRVPHYFFFSAVPTRYLVRETISTQRTCNY